MKFSIKEIEKIIDDECYKHVISETCNSWGCVTPHDTEYITPGELLYVLRKKEKDGKK